MKTSEISERAAADAIPMDRDRFAVDEVAALTGIEPDTLSWIVRISENGPLAAYALPVVVEEVVTVEHLLRPRGREDLARSMREGRFPHRPCAYTDWLLNGHPDPFGGFPAYDPSDVIPVEEAERLTGLPIPPLQRRLSFFTAADAFRPVRQFYLPADEVRRILQERGPRSIAELLIRSRERVRETRHNASLAAYVNGRSEKKASERTSYLRSAHLFDEE